MGSRPGNIRFRAWSRLLWLLALLATSLLMACQLATRAPGLRSPPNVVFFLTDDQRYDTLEHMPIVQRELVARGINFTNAYVTTPLCCPSRASILTGLYAHNHGVVANEGARGGWRRFDPSSTVATWLQAGGVRTMLVGKYLNLYANEGIPPGWSDWFAIWDTGQKYYDYTVNNNGEMKSYGDKEKWYSTDVLAGRATGALKKEQSTPFFLYLSFDGPHAPAEPAKRDQKSFASLPPQRLPSFNEADVSDKPAWIRQLPLLTAEQQQELDKFRRDQIATLQAIDRAVGAVVESLRTDGRLANTWLVFMSDNGISLGEHRYGQHKSCGYEECVRVPLVIVPPLGREMEFGAPRSDARLVMNIDLAPTVADLMGAASAPSVDGVSLLPALADPSSAWHTDGGLELWADDDETAFKGLRSGRWKYLRYVTGEEELYDLEADPYELDNLAGDPDQGPRLAELSARTTALMR